MKKITTFIMTLVLLFNTAAFDVYAYSTNRTTILPPDSNGIEDNIPITNNTSIVKKTTSFSYNQSDISTKSTYAFIPQIKTESKSNTYSQIAKTNNTVYSYSPSKNMSYTYIPATNNYKQNVSNDNTNTNSTKMTYTYVSGNKNSSTGNYTFIPASKTVTVDEGEDKYIKDEVIEQEKQESIETPISTPIYSNPNQTKEFEVLNLSIGDTEKKVIEELGQPSRKDMSEYGFLWYVYNSDYSKFIMVGIKDSKVVGLYTNSSVWTTKKGLHIGHTKTDVINNYGQPIGYIQRKERGITLTGLDQKSVYLLENFYATFFYDTNNNTTITAIMLIEKDTEYNMNGKLGLCSAELATCFELQLLDLTNSIRYRMGKPLLKWSEKASSAALKHSKDMAINNYFSHDSKDGKTPAQRLMAEGISYRSYGENISAGQVNAIYAHENWMNSSNHRRNILSNNIYMGNGVYYGGQYGIYYTECFYSN